MKIAVTSATGQLGGAIIKQLSSDLGKDQVIGLARSPEKVRYSGIETRKGDYTKIDDFRNSLKDVDAVVLLSANGDPEARKQMHANVVDAAVESGVSKIVYTSIVGVEEGNAFSPIVQSNRHTEEYVKKSGLEWVIGRNGIYMEPDIEALDEYRQAGKVANCAGEGKCGYTTRDELAVAYAKLAVENTNNGNTLNLFGEPISQTQLVEWINKAYKTELHYEEMSVEAYLEERKAALGDFLGTVIAGIYTGILTGAYDLGSDFAKAAGRPHQSWDHYFDQLDTAS